MKEQLPTVQIFDRQFQVDIKESEFREITNNSNRIPFSEVQDNGDHLLIAYDKKTRNAFHGSMEELTKSNDVQVVRLPSWKEIVRSNEPKTETLSEQSGPKFLPIVSIDGTDFTADMRLKELRETQQPHNRISFDELDLIGTRLGFLYDPKTKNSFTGTKSELENQKDIRFIILPPTADLSSSHTLKRFTADNIGQGNDHMSMEDKVLNKLEESWDRKLAKGDDEFYEAFHSRSSKTEVKKESPSEETHSRKRKGRGI